MTRKAKMLVLIGLMLGMTLAAIDTTIVGTAMPTIVGKLGGFDLYSWVFSVYLLTSTTSVPIYGKLADLYGRKPIFLFGTALFLLGSVASGASQSMEQLILFRAVQGLGAGAVLPIVLTIIGDIFDLVERAKMQGFFSGVWGVSSVVGPALGGLIVDHFSWRWVFFVNIPFGLLSALLLIVAFKENIKRGKPKLDYAGTLALTGSIVALLFALLQGGTSWAWTSPQSLTLFAVCVFLLAFFLWIETHAPEPILPLTLFKSRIVAVASLGGLILGVTMFGISTYVPLFMQGVKGGSATDAGIVLTPLLLSWPISSFASGQLVLRFGYRITAVAGAILTTLGAAMLLFFHRETSLPFIVVSMLLVGTGLGLDSTSFTLSVQNAVPWKLRGVATASTQFVRTIGGTIGVALMGTILNAQVIQRSAPIFAHFAEATTHLPTNVAPSNILLTPNIHSLVPADFLQQLQTALAQSLFWVYLVVFTLMLVSLTAMFWLPSGRADDLKYKGDDEETAEMVREVSLVG
ncbi:MAG: MDR family MFS transporter [Ktedonobacteraceae bacterium]